jgi:hypothetical protein
MGSDHDVYQDSSFGIPAIYLNDWPDRYIHTNFDAAANIDPTKLKRAGFIGAASGYFLARMTAGDASKELIAPDARTARLAAEFTNRLFAVEPAERGIVSDWLTKYVSFAADSLEIFVRGGTGQSSFAEGYVSPSAPNDARLVFRRKPTPKGPLTVFGYDYFETEWAKLAYVKKPQLLEYLGLWGGGEEYAYEALNFADGKRKAQEIRDAVSAEYGPVPLELVAEYLRALEKIGVVEQVK